MAREKQRNGKLRTKFIAIIFALCLVISVLIGGISIIGLNKTSMEGADTSVSTCAQGYSNAISRAIATYGANVNTAAMNSQVTDSKLSAEEKTKILDDLTKKLGFVSIGTADATGATLNGSNIADREYFQKAIKGEIFISSPLVRKTDQTIVLFIAAKINNGTNYNGVAYAALSNDTFSAMIADAKIGTKGYAFVLDKTGTVIAHPNGKLVSGFENYITKADKEPQYKDLAELSKKMIAKGTSTTEIRIDGSDQDCRLPADFGYGRLVGRHCCRPR